ncbi:MAG: Bifunctional deaminase-reductase domain protein [Candidatus Uhrbacteria bacterium GW2011_GWF2_39_13]|uniref:Bifunctional deaminase-reductase domain protein n=1 Tax=Candidatus Uhrbacteria bacterium GW2011_GWF2_39_13 TaxID=1618995 RepID=A0A0G0MVT1_9BACT|nr:MAG: Bifunctional deaminase-reductase domain protein [Candidatus Uhrbacteria bacterium GW2011_GWF2_39_13]
MEIWLIAAISANGFIAESSDQRSLDWTSKEDTRFFVEKTKEAGVVIMGRKTFETIGKPLKGRRLIVMTRHEGMKTQMEGVEFSTLSPVELINKLTQEGIESFVIAGGSSIYSQFLQAGLVTDLYLTIEPVLFGTGVSFASGFDRMNLNLVEVRKLNEQSVLLHYKV